MSWDNDTVQALYEMPLMDLLYRAHQVHRENFDPNVVQVSTLLSIKTGLCPEDCGYCTQSAHHNTGLVSEKLMSVERIVEKAKIAQQNGATRFCMGAAWRNPPKREWPTVLEIVKAIKALGMETCVTLGMLNEEQAKDLQEAGLDFYNHNLDTSKEYFENVVTTTRTYQDRLDTLDCVRKAGVHVCSGGIIGMGESRVDRINLLLTLANLPEPPLSVPINLQIKHAGTPLGNTPKLDNFEFIRTIAIARILMPRTFVRLSAGREEMSEEMQAMCFFAGANSIHYGEKLLTASNPEPAQDQDLFRRLGIKPLSVEALAALQDRVAC